MTTSDKALVEMIQNFNWNQTPLGNPINWAQSLLTTLNIISSSPTPMALWWGDEMIHFYNHAFIPCLGNERNHPAAFGQPAEKSWYRSTEKLQAIKELVLVKGEGCISENEKATIYRNGKPEIVYWSYSFTPVRDEAGKVAGILIICSDTTAKNESIKNLDLSRERFDNLVRQSTAGIIVLLGKEMVVDIVNHAYGKLIDRTPEELLHRPLFEVIPEAEKDFRPILDNILTTGETLHLYGHPYFVFVNGEKKEGFLDLIYQPFKETDGNIIGVMVLCHDVTQAVESRKNIEEEKERTRLALDAADLGIFEIDLKTDAIITNKRFKEIYGFKGEVTRNDYVTAYHPDDKPIRDLAVKQSAKTGILNFEVRIRHTTGETRWIRLLAKNFLNELQQPITLYGVVADISEERNIRERLSTAGEELAAINEELRASNEEMAASNEELEESNSKLFRVNADLDNFIYTASHDLKAPFNNLEGLLNTLLGEVELKSDLSVLKDMIDLSFQRFKKTLEHLTNISKLQREEELEDSLLDLQEMVYDAIFDIQDQIKTSGAKITTRFDIHKINFSTKNLRSILYNLISNAVKYRSPERTPEIEIYSYQKENCVVIQVSDNGLGLSQKNLSVIFGMFKRAHDHVEGSGIGLFIVKKIIENAGGKIEVESELGKGSIFRVYLRNDFSR